MYGVCFLAVIPLRAAPNDQSEMISQVLFGEHFTILEKLEKWTKIKLAQDQYEGYVDQKQYILVSEEDYQSFLTDPKFFVQTLFAKATHKNQDILLPMGAILPNYNKGIFQVGTDFYKLQEAIESIAYSKESLHKVAKLFLMSPYLWGGKTAMGIDCSGFTQVVFGQFGIQLPRDAYLQATQGELVGFVSQMQAGDLAFFENLEGNIVHVGIVWSETEIIHAHGKVRIDLLDDLGIFQKKTGKHSHRLRFIKRFF